MQGGYAVTGAQTPTSAAPAGARPGQVSTFHDGVPPHVIGHWVAPGSLDASPGVSGSGHAIPVSL
jgi:hypothetical protein